jgi:DNA polymerase kappa
LFFHIHCRTFAPIGQKEEILEKLDEVAAELEKDMEQNGWTGRTVTLKYKLDTYQGVFISNVFL